MAHESLHVSLTGLTADLAAVFTTASTEWLRSFLQLSLALDRSGDRSSQLPMSFELSVPTELDAEVTSMPFVWCPHDGVELFRRFEGRFVLVCSADHATLGLEGHADGGSSERNRRVMGALLELLAKAFSADQPVFG